MEYDTRRLLPPTPSIETKSSATTEIVRDADDVDFSVDDVQCTVH